MTPLRLRRAVSSTDEGMSRAAQVFVLLALVMMLVGAVLILAAREHAVVDVAAGGSATLFDHQAPAWDPFSHPLAVTVYGPANVTLAVGTAVAPPPGNVTVQVETDAERDVEEQESMPVSEGHRVHWEGQAAQPGESWSVRVENRGDETVRVAGQVYSTLFYVVGGSLVGVGVLGFVVYRMGMRASG